MNSFVFLVAIAISGWYVCNTDAQSCSIDRSKRFGGTGGGAFDEKCYRLAGDITEIKLECGKYVNALTVRYGFMWAKRHGWVSSCTKWFGKGALRSYKLRPGEYLSGMVISYGKYINSITLKTNLKTIPTCGSTKGSKTESVNPMRVRYFTGRSGCIIDALQLHGPKW